jgi:hypothetical protein
MRPLFVLLVIACGTPAPPVEEPPPPQASVEEPVAPAEEPPAPEPEPSPLAALIAELEESEDVPSGSDVTFATALAECPRAGDRETCNIDSRAGFDAANARWVMLEVDGSEMEISSVWLGTASGTAEQPIWTGALDARGLTALRRALRPFHSLAVSPNLVAGSSSVEFSIDAYTPLVSLRAPFEGWLLYLETVEDLDAPEHVLSLVKRDLSERIELLRRRAPFTACDGDGWTCEASETDCTPEQLRAEDRLCVQPFGIQRVSLAADRATLFVGGTGAEAGHGGYPPFHFVVALEGRAREVISP